uniref:Palustrin-1a n=1 Tax=Lithobates palustris TaxID=298395 RepID=PA1A_LITPA|nr:RecName: Full=Palustrin-1a [Lithobates palustris]
ALFSILRGLKKLGKMGQAFVNCEIYKKC